MLRAYFRLGLFLMVALAAVPAGAARFHVESFGTRNGGASLPDDWAPENCYPTLAAASAAASPVDTILLSDEAHGVNTPVTLSCLLTNRHLIASPIFAELMVTGSGTLVVDPDLGATELRGIDIGGDGVVRAVAALSVANPSARVDSVVIRGCAFHQFAATAQAAAGGGALRALSPGNGTRLILDDCSFSSITTAGNGGAIWIGGGYTVSVNRCGFQGNHTTNNGQGGAIMVAAASAHTYLAIADAEFHDNTAAGPGGAINVDSGSLDLLRCRIEGSRTAWETGAFFKEGAGLRVTRSGGHTDPVNVLVQNCVFRDNQGNLSDNNGAGDGGGILIKGGDVTRMTWARVDHCRFEANTNAQGAGLYLGRFCQGEVTYCRFIDNIAWYQGGGAFKGGELPECYGELATFAYCEFRGNRAGFKPDGTQTDSYSRGGGVLVRLWPRAHLYNCSFFDNRVNDFSYAVGDGFAHTDEGGPWQELNRCTLVNCAFWGEGGDIQVRCEGNGGMELVSNVAVRANQMSVPGTTPIQTVVLTAMPYLGPTDLRPVANSPLIDGGAVVPYLVDLCNVPVPVGPAFDVGCHESNALVGVRDDIPTPDTPRLTVAPNPFNPRTTLRLELATAGPVVVGIYDARGRRVVELLRGELTAGPHAVAWNGADQAGHAVSAGTYLAVVESGEGAHAATKLMLVK